MDDYDDLVVHFLRRTIEMRGRKRYSGQGGAARLAFDACDMWDLYESGPAPGLLVVPASVVRSALQVLSEMNNKEAK